MLDKESSQTVGQERGQLTEAGKGKIPKGGKVGNMVTVKFG